MKMLMRILLYCVGLMFLAFGVAFSVNSNLGVSPVNSLPYVISLILKVDLGRCIIGLNDLFPVLCTNLYHWCVYNLHDCADHHQAKRV